MSVLYVPRSSDISRRGTSDTVRMPTLPFSPISTTVTDFLWPTSEKEYLSGVPQ